MQQDNTPWSSSLSLSLSLSLSMGERGCETCRKWQEHYYWEHMDVSKIRFFKLMTGDFTKGISIPKKLAKKFNWTESFDLKSPNGETWNVGTSRNADELFLMSGWENFAKAHGLQENDLLVFTCSGNTYFDVLIFEASGCEKVSSLFGNRAAGPNMRRHFHNTEDWGQHAGGHNSLSDSEDTTTPSQLVGSLHHASTSKKSGGRNPKKLPPQSPNSSNNDHVKCDVIREEGSDEEHANSNYYYTRTADRLSDEEKEVIVSLASIQSDNPAFVTVLQMSHVRCKSNFLIFPSRFVADHLDSRLHEITLVRPNRKDKWCVKYCYACNGVQGIRNYTFSIFVQENRLRKGDICAFELMKGTRRVTMTVHVIRKVDGGRFVLVG